jgi:probable F420-dependent oxidoreductase
VTDRGGPPGPGTTVGLQIGAMSTEILDHRALLPFAAQVESLGFDSMWIGEHILWRAAFMDPLTVAAAVMGATQRLRLGTSALILPLHHPVRLAKAVATIDVLGGGGRFVLGAGVGGENPREFDAMGVPLAGRGARADEILTVLRRLWAEDSVSHAGPCYPLSDVTLLPRPATRGGPPIWIAGRSAAALRRAARYGDGWLPYLVSSQQLADGLAQIRTEAARSGRDLAAFTPAVQLFVCVDTVASATDRLTAFLEGLYAQPMRHLIEDRCVVGPPDRCVTRLGEYIEAGAQALVVQVPGWGPHELTHIRLVADTVLPAITAVARRPQPDGGAPIGGGTWQTSEQ